MSIELLFKMDLGLFILFILFGMITGNAYGSNKVANVTGVLTAVFGGLGLLGFLGIMVLVILGKNAI